MKQWHQSDELNLDVTFPKGTSIREPGITPSEDLTVKFETLSKMEDLCGESRIWSGVHFRDAVDNIKEIARFIGQRANRFMLAHVYPDQYHYHYEDYHY